MLGEMFINEFKSYNDKPLLCEHKYHMLFENGYIFPKYECHVYGLAFLQISSMSIL